MKTQVSQVMSYPLDKKLIDLYLQANAAKILGDWYEGGQSKDSDKSWTSRLSANSYADKFKARLYKLYPELKNAKLKMNLREKCIEII